MYRDVKIMKYKSRLASALVNLQNNFYNTNLNDVLGYYMASFSYLYAYETKEKSNQESASSSKLTTKLEEQNILVETALAKFTGLNNFGITILKNDIDRLNPRCWLNDNIINYYLHLLVANTLSSGFVFETFFYSSLMRNGITGVQNWYKNINIFQFEIIYIPININNNHWILVTVENMKCKVTIYDSFHQNQDLVLSQLKNFLTMKYMQLYGVQLTSHWCFVQEYEIPVQRNTYDCGVFICKIAQCKSLNLNSFDFMARDMDFYRKNILHSILLNKII